MGLATTFCRVAGAIALGLAAHSTPAQVPEPARDVVVASRAALDAAPECCASMAQFRFERPPLHFDRAYAVDRSSKAYRFPSGKSYFVAFELPQWSPQHQTSARLNVSSVISGPLGEAGSSLLCPVFVFLDELLRPIGERRDELFYASGPRGKGNPEMGAIIALKDSLRNARYVVVFTDAAAVAGKVSLKIVQQIGSGSKDRQSLGSVAVPCNHEGQIKVHISPGS